MSPVHGNSLYWLQWLFHACNYHEYNETGGKQED